MNWIQFGILLAYITIGVGAIYHKLDLIEQALKREPPPEHKP